MKKGRTNMLVSKNYSCSIVVPCYNEEDNVAECIKRAPKIGKFTEIIISDDGSQDGTVEVAMKFKAKYRNLKVLASGKNRGKGLAVKFGADRAKGDIILVWDADRTVPAKELHRFYDVLATGQAQFANGTRFAYAMENRAMPIANFIGNMLFGVLYSWIFDAQITDTLCGTKALFRKDCKKIVFGTELWGDYDLLFGARTLGLKIKEVPIHYKARVAGQSKMKTFRYGLVIAKMALKGIWKFKILPLLRD